MGNRNVVIARELTKKYEEYVRGSVQELLSKDLDLKGEMVIIVEGSKKEKLSIELCKLSIQDHFEFYVDQGYDSKQAMKLVAKDRDISKSDVYSELLKNI